MESQNYYDYDMIDSAKREIRLLVVEPAINVEAAIRCHLFRTSLYSRPKYETLSYRWGDPTKTVSILLHEQLVSVTVNLESALRHLRRVDEARILWADALCINQGDTVEKTAQVKMMTKIYKYSSRTVLWLGVGQQPLRSQALEMFGQTFANDLKMGASEARTRLLGLEQSDLRKFAAELCGVVTRNDVWNRVWVAQEVTVTQELILQYGTHELQWWSTTCLFHGIYEILRISFDPLIGQQFVDKNANVRILVQRFTTLGNEYSKLPLFATYLAFGNLGAEKPVDHIYALEGLSSDFKKLGLTTDYGILAHDLMRTLVRSHIREYHTLSFLELASICTLDGKWETSWTPNLERSLRIFPLVMQSGYSAGNQGHDVSWTSIEDLSDAKKLILNGIKLDTVKKVTSTTSDTLLSPEATREMFQKTAPKDPNSTYGNGQTKFDAYWRTLMFDATARDRIQPWEIDGFRTAFQGILNGSNELSPDHEAQQFWSHKQQILVSFAAGTIPCNFGLTLNGLMARFPKGTKEGDIVAILYGGRTPFILRPNLANQAENFLVGPAYVHGFMDGEAITSSDAGNLEQREFVLV